MGKLQEFDVIFEHPLGVFHAGEVLKGAVVLTLSEPMKMRNMRIWFSGRAKVHWAVHKGSGNTRHRIHYRAEEVYIDHTNVLFGSLDGDGELHPEGRHQYEFEVPLPLGLPSSFEGEHGYVRYFCKVTIDKPWKFDHEMKTAFTVLSHLDLNDEPEQLRTAMQGSDSSDISCCCWRSGQVTASFSINKRGFVPGEPVLPYAEVRNNSNAPVSHVRVAIKQYTEFLGHSDSIFSSGDMKAKVEKYVIAEAQRGPIPPRGTYVWDDLSITLPPVPPSRLVGCNIINCTYVVKFYVSVNYGNDIKVACEVIVGTIPLRDTLTTRYGVTYRLPGVDESGEPGTTSGDEEGPEAKPLPLPPPPSYEEYTIKKSNIAEEGDTEYTRGRLEYAPHYPFYRQLSFPEQELHRV